MNKVISIYTQKRFFLIFFLFLLQHFCAQGQAPTVGASAFSITNVEGNRFRVNWTRGNGSQILVVASLDPNFNGDGIPADGTDYTESTTFGSGGEIGTDNFVVYEGTGTFVTIIGLVHSTTYYLRLYEFNGTGASTAYNTVDVLSGDGTTLSPPTVGSTNLIATPTGNSASLTWTRGNGTRSLVILEAGSTPANPVDYTNYTGSSTFGSGSAIGSGRVVYHNSSNLVNVTNLQPNTTYFYRVVEGNGTTNPVYDLANALTGSFTTGGAPTQAATNFGVGLIEGNRFRVNWTRGNGSQVLVVASLSPTFNGAGTPADGTDYTASATFGSGNLVGTGNFVVYEGTGTTVTITGLVHSTTYYIRIFEFNGTGTGTVYNTTDVLSGDGTTLFPPTVGPTNLIATPTPNSAALTWTRGNGTRSLVILQAGSSPADPADYTNYTGNATFGSGTAIGGGHVVYHNSSNLVNVTNLLPNTVYFYRIVEGNGTTGPVYDVANALTGSFITQNLNFVSIDPQPNEIHVSANANISVTFDLAIDASSVGSSGIIVRGSQTGVIDGTLSGGGSPTITFDPNTNFKPGETITVTITTSLASQTGLRLLRGHTYSFTVASGLAPSTPVKFAQRRVSFAFGSTSPNDISALDFDHDGDMDIITAIDAPVSDLTEVWINNGNHEFCDQKIGEYKNVEVYDIDGDGDFDSFGTGGNATYVNWYRNEGNGGNPTEISIQSGLINSLSLAGGDLDSDGDVDVVAVTEILFLGNRLVWYRNNGGGNFSSSTLLAGLPVPVGSDSYLYQVDINRDGAMDILAYWANPRELVWYENDGSETFTTHLVTTTAEEQRLSTADLDQDGDLDILATSTSSTAELSWYENDGNENFTFRSIALSPGTSGLRSVKSVDIDGDTDLDLVAGPYWFENDGSQNFSQYVITPGLANSAGGSLFSHGVNYGDMDGDGDMDLLTHGFVGNGFRWQENGRFMSVTSTTPGNASHNVPTTSSITMSFDQPIDNATLNTDNISVMSVSRGIVSGTFSGGGTNSVTFNPTTNFLPGEKIEVAITNKVLSLSGHNLEITYGFDFRVQTAASANPAFTASSIVTHGSLASGLDVGDVDGDGDLDVVTCSSTELFWHQNNGSGTFTTIPITATGTPLDVSITDYDRDGAMDILVGVSGFSYVHINDGNENFTEIQIFSVIGTNQLTDVNRDGDTDVVAAGWLDRNCDTFASATLPAPGAGTQLARQAADLDNDGDIDFVNSRSTGSTYLLNDGYLNYSLNSIEAVNTTYSDLVDLDGDGDLDALNVLTNSSIVWYENNLTTVSANFGSRNTIGALSGNPRRVIASDIDGDGDADVVAISRTDDQVVWYENRLNEVSADFSAANALPSISDGPHLLEVADLNGDGRMDVVVLSNVDNELVWYANNGTGSTLPTISGFTPALGPVGTTVTITGTNFSSISANNTVMFNGTTAVVTVSTPTSITTTVPAGATTGPITVTVAGNTATSPTNFTIVSPQNFITQWNLATAGSGATQLSFGTATSGVANYTWQEISPGSATGSGSWSGTTLTIAGLPAGSTIRLQIAPTNFQRINVSSGLDEDRLTQVEQWGTTAWTSMQNAFRGCTNLQITATDVPNLSGVTNMSSMFESCRSLNSPSNMGTWNTATVTNMTFMFYDATVFNQDIGAWNTSAVTNMNTMFSEALAFNQDIGSWNTAAVTDMSDMFGYTTAFNQDISGWNTEAVTDMSFMFRGASAFNQDISSWNTAAVTDMRGMFREATAFNQNIGAWNLGAVSDIRFMLDNTGMDCNNYSATLIGWSANSSTPNGRTLEATGRQYGTNAVAARSNLTTTKGWTITGDAPSGSLCALAGPPTISSFTPSSGPVGITVTITGTNFSSTPANNTVTFNGTTALVTVSTTTTLTVTVPIGATTGPISVTVGGNTATSATDFTVTTLTITQQPASSTDACTGSSATLTTAATGTTNITYQWQKFNGSVFVDLVNNSTYAGVATATLTINNITLSEAGDYQCVIGGDFVTPVISSTATLVVNTTPASPGVTGGSNCVGSSITLTASGGTDGQYRWYTAATGGTALPGETNGSYTTPALFTTQNYYVAINDGVCESGRSVATATVLGPAAPGVTDAGRCDAGTVTLSATGGASGNYRWYTVPSGGTALPGETNDTFTTPSLTATAIYYVAVDDGTCESARSAVTATIASPPAAPSVTPATTCGPGTVTLAAAGSTDGNYRWYTSSTGGTALPGETNASLVTPALTASTTYYVTISNGICESTRTAVLATVATLPTAPVAVAGSVCENGQVTLSATGATDGNYRWYTLPTGGTALPGETNASYTTPAITATTIFYVSVNDGVCESARVPATAEVLAAPAPPTAADVQRCEAGPVTLTATGGADGQYRWYTTASGGTPDASQQNGTFTTATLNATTAFYVSLNDGNCESDRTEVEAAVETLQAPVITSSQTPAGQTITLCDGETVTLSAPGGFAAYGWSNGADTEQIVVSQAGTYAVTVTSSAGCLSPPSVSFVVVVNNCTSNQPPVISTASAATEIEGTATINLQALISDPDNNEDITTLRIIEFPLSGAAASIDASGNLVINYAGISFSGQDRLTIEVCDSEGICVQQQIFIEVTGDIVVMNGLSPNGDNANDYFQIKYIDVLESTRQNRVTIFNRWGDAVFETTNYDNQNNVFTGKNQSGNDLPSGTYLYRIEFSGGRSPLTGYLVLKR
ncbi:MAG: BspA family leucine-rich repeat surface protein [Bacteroidota bacterium]